MQIPDNSILKIGITGKQNIKPDELTRVYDSIRSKIVEILKNNNTAAFVGYSSMARGADTIFAEVVTKEFRQPLRIILPFAPGEYRKNFTEPRDLQVFDDWISKIGVHKVIDARATINDKFKDEAYLEAGQFIADHCDEVLIVWDKVKPSNPGSTAEILGLIACKRSTNFLDIIDITAVQPDQFNEEIIRQTQQADDEATRLKKKYEGVWKSSIFLGWLAAVCFAGYAAFPPAWNKKIFQFLSLAEFLLVLTVLIIIIISKSRKNHLQFIFQRLKAEKLRLVEIFYNANLKIELKELRDNNDDDLSSLIEMANDKIEKHEYNSTPYSFYCVKNLIEEQINYHVSFLFNKIGNRVHKYEVLSKVITTLFLINLLFSFLMTLTHYFNIHLSFSEWHWVPIFAGIFLSASYAAVESTLYFREWGFLKRNSGSMIDYFKEKKEMLNDNCDQVNPGELLKDISIKMLTDNKNWDFIRGKPDEVKLF